MSVRIRPLRRRRQAFALALALPILVSLALAQADRFPSESEVAPRLVEQLSEPFQGRRELKCDSPETLLHEVLRFQRLQRDGQRAWKITFKRPFECRWVEEKRTASAEESATSSRQMWLSKTTGTAWVTGKEGGVKYWLEDIQVSQKPYQLVPPPGAVPSDWVASPTPVPTQTPAKSN